MSALVLSEQSSLKRLAEVANSEHAETNLALVAAIGHAIRCGEALREAYEIVPKGTWHKWVQENLTFGDGTASRYMRLAYYQDTIPPDTQSSWIDASGSPRTTSFNRVYNTYIRHLPKIVEQNAKMNESDIQEAKRLKEQGMTLDEIARLFDVSRETIRLRLDDKLRQKQKAYYREWQRKRNQAMRLFREQEIRKTQDSAARKQGGAVSELYSLVRRATQKADEAILEAKGAEDATALKNALLRLYDAEDQIAKALRVPAMRELTKGKRSKGIPSSSAANQRGHAS